MEQINQPQLLSTIMQFAARTGISRSGVYREIESGKLKVVRVGRSVRIREQDIQAWCDALTD